MSDLIGTLQAFSAAEINRLNLSLPVKIELMDVSMEPFVELSTTGPDELGLWSFDKKPLAGTLWKKGPHTVRFTAQGTRAFLSDFSWPQPAQS
jgi:hypothetical protein